jgi:hypothetical protein
VIFYNIAAKGQKPARIGIMQGDAANPKSDAKAGEE